MRWKINYPTHLLFCGLIFCSGFSSESDVLPLKINFNDLALRPDLDDEIIEIKGFIYNKGDGEFILAKEPGIKTCCLESAREKESKIQLVSNLTLPCTSFPVTLKGRLKKNSLSKIGEAAPHAAFRLEDASISQHEEENSLKIQAFLLFALSLFSIASALYFRKRLLAFFRK